MNYPVVVSPMVDYIRPWDVRTELIVRERHYTIA